MKLYAITILDKDTQFSKEEREDSFFPTTFILARSLAEARKRAVSYMVNHSDRVAVTELGEPTIYFNKVLVSEDLDG